MSEPTLYQAGRMPRAVGSCLICGNTERLVHDHCHAHGWVRGILCASCNSGMAVADDGRLPDAWIARIGSEEAIHAHRKRCHECAPVTLQKPTPPSYTSIRISRDASAELRALVGVLMTQTGRKVSMSDALYAAATIGSRYLGEAHQELNTERSTR